MEIAGNIGHDTTFVGMLRVAQVRDFKELLEKWVGHTSTDH